MIGSRVDYSTTGILLGGVLHTKVDAPYPIEDIQPALEHAAREGRDGKILVTSNGPVG